MQLYPVLVRMLTSVPVCAAGVHDAPPQGLCVRLCWCLVQQQRGSYQDMSSVLRNAFNCSAQYATRLSV